MINILKNSLVIGFIVTLIQRLQVAYKESLIAKIAAYLSTKFRELTDNSKIISFVKRRDYYSRVLEHSFFISLFDKAMNVIPRFLNTYYTKYGNIFSESIIVRFAINILRRMEIILALSLVFIIIVPHENWNNLYTTIIALALTAMLFLRIVFHRFESFNVKALDFALILFMLCVLLATGNSFFPKESMRFLIFFATCFLFVIVIVSSVNTERSLNNFIEILLIGVTITGLYGIYQAKILGIPVDPSYTDIITNSDAKGRVFSTVGNPNNYAEILLMTIPFYFAVVLNSKSLIKKIVYSLLAVPPLISLVWTSSRSAWLCFAGSVLIFVYFKNKKLLPLFILAGIAFMPFMPQSIYRRLMSLTQADTSAQYRVKIYKTVIPMFVEYWKAGIGLGTDVFMGICRNYYQYTSKVPPHSHNLFLQVWIETGLMGIVSFVWFIGRLIKKCILNLSNKTDANINNILIAGICSVIGVSVMGFAEYIWYYPRVMLIFWVAVAIVLAALSISMRKREGISHKSVEY
ncbi:MAG TPA: O-antigen ligase family protein [Pseudobacteroides sp.]|nr:O-antigen ligase family protein [Pseudobacteroides sp.]